MQVEDETADDYKEEAGDILADPLLKQPILGFKLSLFGLNDEQIAIIAQYT